MRKYQVPDRKAGQEVSAAGKLSALILWPHRYYCAKAHTTCTKKWIYDHTLR